MKNLVSAILVLLLTNTAFANFKEYQVTEENKSLAIELSRATGSESVIDESRMQRINESELQWEALYAWNTSNKEFRDLLSVHFRGLRIFVVKDAPEGNGCYYYFNTCGEYLNSYCYSEESGDSFWAIKQ